MTNEEKIAYAEEVFADKLAVIEAWEETVEKLVEDFRQELSAPVKEIREKVVEQINEYVRELE